MRNLGGILIIVAGCFWGTMGIFVRDFTAMGFTTMQIAAIRLAVAAVVLGVGLLLVRPRLFRVKLRDLPLLALLGVLSIGIMGYLYFTTIGLSTLSVAAVLLYLSPVVVTILSYFVFKEPIGLCKKISVILAVIGCALVSGIVGQNALGATALLTGIGSAITYGSYSILGPIALKKYSPFTVTFYAFGAAAVVLFCLSNPMDLIQKIGYMPDCGGFVLHSIGIGTCTALIPFVLYTVGLVYTTPSQAAVLACTEPIAATVIGMMVYREFPDWFGYMGILLVMIAIVLIGKEKSKI